MSRESGIQRTSALGEFSSPSTYVGSANYAVVVPVNLAERRTDLDLGRRHTLTTAIAIGGLIIALTGLVISIVPAR